MNTNDPTLTSLQMLALNSVRLRYRGNEITGKEVAGMIGLKPRSTGKEGADMRSIIHALRVKGYPICANGKGYFWANTRSELDEFTDSFVSRIRDQQRACDGMKANRDYEVMEAIEI